MMRMRTKNSPPAAEMEEKTSEWEVRPGGMLVQKRNAGEDGAPAGPPVPTIRVKVKHGAVYHEIYLSSQATFGELKKLISERTGLHHLDQKIVYKDKERNSSAYLDTAGVRDGSKLVVMMDATAQARRILEARHAAKSEKATKAIGGIATDVDKLTTKVVALEAIVNKGKKVADEDLQNLIEQLMNQLVKLDAVVADGDAKQQRGMQVRRVQKYVEKLDMLKVKNSVHNQQSPQQQPQQQQHPKPPKPQPHSQRQRHSSQQQQLQTQSQPQKQQQQLQMQSQPQKQQQPVVTTDWEVFDSLFSPSSSAATTTATVPVSSRAVVPTTPVPSSPVPRFDWELF